MECTHKFYIHNYHYKECSEFDESLLKKGLSAYEVMRVEKGTALFLEKHLNRLFDTAEISGMVLEEGYCDFEELIFKLIRKNNYLEGKIKLVIHYNSKKRLRKKDLLLYYTPHYFPSADEYKLGVATGFCKAVRKNPNAKILNTVTRKKANKLIKDRKYFEVLLTNKKGFITEGSRSNVFFIKEDKVITPPEENILKGIARNNIINICNSINVKVVREDIHMNDIKNMDAVFLSGTSLKALPVNRIEEVKFSTDNVLLKKIVQLYDKCIKEYIFPKLT